MRGAIARRATGRDRASRLAIERGARGTAVLGASKRFKTLDNEDQGPIRARKKGNRTPDLSHPLWTSYNEHSCEEESREISERAIVWVRESGVGQERGGDRDLCRPRKVGSNVKRLML